MRKVHKNRFFCYELLFVILRFVPWVYDFISNDQTSTSVLDCNGSYRRVFFNFPLESFYSVGYSSDKSKGCYKPQNPNRPLYFRLRSDMLQFFQY